MNIEVITSFNQAYYNLIGRECVSTWLEYWPKELSLTCYVEKFELEPNPRIRQIDFEQLGNDYITFQKTADTQVGKFAKKAYSFIHAMFHSTADRIIWLDADVITEQDLPKTLLDSLLPDNVLSTHMGVTYYESKDGTPGNWFVPETGFFAINTTHPDFDRFRTEYLRRYNEQDRSNLRRFYDNDVYGAALQLVGSATLDIASNLKKAYKTPLRHTVLGPYLHHYKAKHSKESYKDQVQ